MRIITLSTAAATLALLAAPAMAETANFAGEVDDKCVINADSLSAADRDVIFAGNDVEFSITCNNDFLITFKDGGGTTAANTVTMSTDSTDVTADYATSFTGTATLSGMKTDSGTGEGPYLGQNSDVKYAINWGPEDDTGLAAGTYDGSATILVTSTTTTAATVPGGQ